MIHIAHQRLINQKIIDKGFQQPQDAVEFLGAVQAQDYPMSKWAVGIRTKNATDKMVEQALDEGLILRTHILRPTWHLVSHKDIRWMLALTAPHIHQISAHYNRKMELSNDLLNLTDALLAKAVEGHKHLTKAELMAHLELAGINTSEGRSSLILIHAELNGVLCSGKQNGKNNTYALLEERVTPAPSYTREESLGLLARRYFRSHGPATLHDFGWWSGLKISDAKAGLESVKEEFLSETIENQTYWFLPDIQTALQPSTFLLPAFDEFMVSYKNRAASLDSSNVSAAITANGIFKPIIVVDGQVKGLWSRTLQKEKVSIKTHFFSDTITDPLLTKAAKEFASFLGKEMT